MIDMKYSAAFGYWTGWSAWLESSEKDKPNWRVSDGRLHV
jgi:hypothetical protein